LSSDAGTDAGPVDAGPRDAGTFDAGTFDAGPRDAGPNAGIDCGGSTCDPSTQFCCVTGNSPVEQCTAQNAVGPRCDFGAYCDGPEDCPRGESCCGPTSAVSESVCRPSCVGRAVFCHADADCASGDSCCPVFGFGWTHSECMAGQVCAL
jgi:hypothetical protein